MNEMNSDMENKYFSITQLTGLSIGYITICGILWHIGFWSTFDFNYFQYANISDLFKSSIFPFFERVWVSLFTMIICIGLSAIVTPLTLFILLKKGETLKQTPLKFTPILSKYLKWYYLFISLCLCIAALYLLGAYRRNIIPVTWFIGIGIVTLVFIEGVFSKYFKNDIYRFFVISGLVFYPLFSFANAKTTALQIEYRFIYDSISDIDVQDTILKSIVLNQPILGTTEKYTFVLTGNKRVTILANEQIKMICITAVVADTNYGHWLNRR